MGAAITVFGAGYVGLVTGACLAHSGHSVTMVETDAARVSDLSAGKCPIFEPGLEELLREGITGGHLTFTESTAHLPEAEFAFVAVGTPTTAAGSADLTAVRAVIDTLATEASEGTVTVMKSTVPPGTGARLATTLAPRSVGYVSNPEFLREGTAVTDWYECDRIVLGGQAEAVGQVQGLYSDIEAPVLSCDVTSAELIKYASNAFLATKISYINEIAQLCDVTGADIEQVAAGVGMDRRIGVAFLNAGIGYGGSCFPKDTRALDFLARMNGYDFHLLRAVIEVNARQRVLPVRTMLEHFGSLAGHRIAVLGVTFKPGTDDVREAPAIEIASLLAAEGAEVVTYDPMGVTIDDIESAGSIHGALAGSHGAVVATEWPEIVGADWGALEGSMAPSAAGPIVFDGRNCLDPRSVTQGGARYVGVGHRGGGECR